MRRPIYNRTVIHTFARIQLYYKMSTQQHTHTHTHTATHAHTAAHAQAYTQRSQNHSAKRGVAPHHILLYHIRQLFSIQAKKIHAIILVGVTTPCGDGFSVPPITLYSLTSHTYTHTYAHTYQHTHMYNHPVTYISSKQLNSG